MQNINSGDFFYVVSVSDDNGTRSFTTHDDVDSAVAEMAACLALCVAQDRVACIAHNDADRLAYGLTDGLLLAIDRFHRDPAQAMAYELDKLLTSFDEQDDGAWADASGDLDSDGPEGCGVPGCGFCGS